MYRRCVDFRVRKLAFEIGTASSTHSKIMHRAWKERNGGIRLKLEAD